MVLPMWFRQAIGVAEILAGIGLWLPMLIGILPWLRSLAAAGLVVLMISAAIFHVPRRGNSDIALKLVLLALAEFVAYGRYVLVPA